MRKVHSPYARKGAKPILPGRVHPTWFESQWSVEGERHKWDYPVRDYEGPDAQPVKVVCPVCHSIADGKRWFQDEKEYQRLRRDPKVRVELCPADTRIQRQMYDGEIVLKGSWMQQHKDEILNFVRNEEQRAMDTNPMSRLAALQDRGDHIYILTTSQSLARRIGAGMKSAFKGRLTIQRLPYENFTRVRWARD